MSDAGHSPGPPGVLIVDDENNILRSLKRLLADEEFPLFTAISGEEGLQILRTDPGIGLIISDQRMPGMTGAEFLARARDVNPEALRIMLTGYADLKATIDAINKGGACRYVTKPWNDAELLQTIRDALRNFVLTQDNRRLAAIVQQQNEELQEWNSRLKSKVLQQTVEIRQKNDELCLKNQNLKKIFHDTIMAFSGLVEMYSTALRNHSRNVAELSARVAQAMGLSAGDTEMIYVAGLLHDIGEIGTPDVDIHKRIDELKEHAVRGQAAIDAIEGLRPVGVLIRHHHEHFDGTGRPDGLRGEGIPLGARIIAMADHVDRTRQAAEENNLADGILPSLEKRLGSHLDPALFHYFRVPVEELFRPMDLQTHRIEQVCDPEALRNGMVLAEDLYSGTGLLLLGKGICLDEKMIVAIRRFQQLDPGKKPITVLVKD
jgi:putative nucleotidyltransferase with HDIG domain